MENVLTEIQALKQLVLQLHSKLDQQQKQIQLLLVDAVPETKLSEGAQPVIDLSAYKCYQLTQLARKHRIPFDGERVTMDNHSHVAEQLAKKLGHPYFSSGNYCHENTRPTFEETYSNQLSDSFIVEEDESEVPKYKRLRKQIRKDKRKKSESESDF